MNTLEAEAIGFFETCQAGKGWAECAPYCAPDASFAAQAGALAQVKTLPDYCEWMAEMIRLMPDGSYDLKGFAVDEVRRCALGYAVFRGTHTGEGGPLPPTAKSTASDYVYHIKFNETGKIQHLDKIWNDGIVFRDLGWS